IIGQQHPAVALLQERLIAHGLNPGPVDGIWGTRTQAATQDFQRAQGWTGADADGIPGPTTWARLLTDPIDTRTDLERLVNSMDVNDLEALIGRVIDSKLDAIGNRVYVKAAEVARDREK